MASETLREAVERRNGTAITDLFWDVWWVCPDCGRSYPRDHAPDYCEDGGHARLRANDDIRLARGGDER